MKSSDSLRKTIASLSKEEKRNFRAFAAMFDEDPGKYVKLFDAFEQDPEFEESTFPADNPNQFYALKHYLKDRLMRSLRIKSELPLKETLESVLDALVFAERGMMKDANKEMRAAIASALEAEANEVLPFVISIAISLHKRGGNFSGYKTEARNLLTLCYTANETIQRITTLELMHIQVKEMIEEGKGPGKYEETITSILAHIYENKRDKRETQKEEILKMLVELDIAWLRNNTSQCIVLSKKILQKLYPNSFSLGLETGFELEIQHSLLGHLIRDKQFEEADELANKIQNSIKNSEKDSFILAEKYTLPLISHAIETGKQESAERFINQTELFLHTHIKTVSHGWQMCFQYLKALHHFFKGDNSKALLSVNSFLSIPKSKAYLNFQGYVRILQLILHVEAGNDEWVIGQLPLVKKFFRSRELFPNVSPIIFAMIAELCLPSADRKATLEKHLPSLKALNETIEGSKFLSDFHLIFWIESRLSVETVYSIIQNAL